MRSPAAAAFSLAGWIASRGSRLIVLHYHQVLEHRDPMRPDVFDTREFAVHMSVLADSFRVLPLSEAVEMLVESRLPPRAVCISFDDGYADNYRVALPVLQAFGLDATFFVAAGFLDGGCMFNDMIIEACRHAPAGRWQVTLPGLDSLDIGDTGSRLRARDRLIDALKYTDMDQRRELSRRLLSSVHRSPPGSLMMSSEQLLSLEKAGMEIGGHTLNHPILARLDDKQALAEIRGGRDRLAALLGRPPALFAYPNGKPGADFLPRDVELVRRAGFRAAFTTGRGSASPNSDIYQLPRIGSWDRSRMRFGLRLLQACFLNA